MNSEHANRSVVYTEGANESGGRWDDGPPIIFKSNEIFRAFLLRFPRSIAPNSRGLIIISKVSTTELDVRG